MMRTAQIDVDQVTPGLYDVVVDSFTSARSFRVTLGDNTFLRLGRGRSREEFIRDSFRFLLTREPKEQIVAEFDITDISTYFPDYEVEIVKD